MRFFICWTILYAGNFLLQYGGIVPDTTSMEGMLDISIRTGFIIGILLAVFQDIASMFKQW